MAETVTMPKLGFDMREGVLVRWLRTEGETIQKGEVLAEIETDKATVEVESTAAGVVRKLLANQGDVVPVGAPIAIIGAADERIETGAAPVTAPTPQAAIPSPAPPLAAQTVPGPGSAPLVPPPPAAGPVKASPLAKKLAREKNIDLTRLQGSGPGGRIVRRDIEAALTAAPVAAAAAPVAADQVVQPGRLRQIIARRMSEAKQTIPHFYVTHEYRLDALMALRQQVNDFLPQEEKLSLNDFIIKAAALALRQFPNLNASFAGEQIIHHTAINIGVAVAVENGLLTVVNKNTDQQPLSALSADLKRKVAAARQGRVRPEDIEGSTFSISNLGMYDVENFSAIINPPEAAILAVGSARQVPVVEEGAIKIGWRMKATLSVDHRVSDGVEAARFMQALAEYLENPLRMLV